MGVEASPKTKIWQEVMLQRDSKGPHQHVVRGVRQAALDPNGRVRVHKGAVPSN